MTPIARSEDLAPYGKSTEEGHEDETIAEALSILRRRAKKPKKTFASPTCVSEYFQLKLAALEHEVFAVAFLDSQNRLIEMEEMFRGTLTQASVYPREITKAALRHNAASVVFSHNHPSGSPEPSQADEALTEVLKRALALVDIRTLDHVIVTTDGTFSFAEKGLL